MRLRCIIWAKPILKSPLIIGLTVVLFYIGLAEYIYNFIRHIGSHIQYKKAIYTHEDIALSNVSKTFNEHGYPDPLSQLVGMFL